MEPPSKQLVVRGGEERERGNGEGGEKPSNSV